MDVEARRRVSENGINGELAVNIACVKASGPACPTPFFQHLKICCGFLKQSRTRGERLPVAGNKRGEILRCGEPILKHEGCAVRAQLGETMTAELRSGDFVNGVKHSAHNLWARLIRTAVRGR